MLGRMKKEILDMMSAKNGGKLACCLSAAFPGPTQAAGCEFNLRRRVAGREKSSHDDCPISRSSGSERGSQFGCPKTPRQSHPA